MRLGTETGSLINHLTSRVSGAPAPAIGMGCTHLGWTDRAAYTVLSVSKTGKRCTVQADTAIRVDSNGMSDDQSYDFTPNPKGRIRVLRQRKDGTWAEVGAPHVRFTMGRRSAYHDYSF